MTGVTDAASAVLHTGPPTFFPALGVITDLRVFTYTGGGWPFTINGVTVRIAGRLYDCGMGGGFLAEVGSTTLTTAPAKFTGATVKVEMLGGQLYVAYTVHDAGTPYTLG